MTKKVLETKREDKRPLERMRAEAQLDWQFHRVGTTWAKNGDGGLCFDSDFLGSIGLKMQESRKHTRRSGLMDIFKVKAHW